KMACLALVAVLLPACATNSGANYVPLVDGPRNASFHADLEACQSLAKDRNYLNGDTQNDAMLGAIAGGLIGGIEADSGDTLEGILAGAVVGSVIGGAESAYDVSDERRHIVVQCMSGRGHRVVG
ncbi:MAG: glycine zipper family protein, partial [Pseudomonadota bacterium]